MTMWKRPEGIQTALDLNGQGLNLARRLGDQSLIVTIQQHRALILNAAGQLEEARQVAEDGAAVAAGLRHRQLLALCVFRLGAIALTGGDPEGALDGLTRSLAMARELGWIELRALALVGLTQANVLLERYDGAGASIEECLHCYEALTPRRFTILSEAMATVEKSRQQGDRAAVMLDIARKLRSDYSLRLSESWRPRQEDANPRRTRRLSRAALVPGGPLYKERLAAALLQLRSAPPAAGHHTTPPRSGSLTRREREVVDLIGMGLTNRQIAERLSIAERTAEGHVERLRKKLRVHSRSAIAARMELLDAGAAEEAVDAGAQRRPSRVV